jgi:hypothetical protein
MTMMCCAFDRNSLILRAYGEAAAVRPRDATWHALIALFPALEVLGPRSRLQASRHPPPLARCRLDYNRPHGRNAPWTQGKNTQA